MFLLTYDEKLINLKNIRMNKIVHEGSPFEHHYKRSMLVAYLDTGEVVWLSIILTDRKPMNDLQHEDDCDESFKSFVKKLAQHNLIIE